MGFISIPTLVGRLLSRVMVQTRRNKREKPGEKQRSRIICKLSNTYLENGGPNSSQKGEEVRCVNFLSDPPSRSWVYPTSQAISVKNKGGKKKHTFIWWRPLIWGLQHHMEHFFFFKYHLSLPCLSFFLGWKGSLKPSAFHSPRICALILRH